MGRKAQGKTPTGLGVQILKGKRVEKRTQRINQQYAGRHITDIAMDGGAGKLESVTDRNELDEFLCNALLAEQQFVAEREKNIVILDAPASAVVIKAPSAESGDNKTRDMNFADVPIPRRPKWNEETTPEELDLMEREAFLDWRRKLAQMEEATHKVVTPFEKNLEVWRQLWRVVERSDVVIQVVDARDPLLYRNLDLERYVRECGAHKILLLIINKADFLSPAQRKVWAEYFVAQKVEFLFFSAALEQLDIDRIAHEQKENEKRAALEAAIRAKKKAMGLKPSAADVEQDSRQAAGAEPNAFDALGDEEEEDIPEEEADNEEEETERTEEDEKAEASKELAAKSVSFKQAAQEEEEEEEEDEDADQDDEEAEEEEEDASEPTSTNNAASKDSESKSAPIARDATHIYDRHEVLQYCLDAFATRCAAKGRQPNRKDGRVTIGMVGYPNVGKSSTINALTEAKKVSVAPTPGHTKHFQTLLLGDDICVCDCPGLVFPTFLSSPAELTVSGILPIDQCRDYRSPVQVLCERISRDQFWYHYRLAFAAAPAGKHVPVNMQELLDRHAVMKGFMKDQGRPDDSRSARLLLKDYVNGKLLYCHAPPHLNEQQKARFYAASTASALAGATTLGETALGKVVTEDGTVFKRTDEQAVDVAPYMLQQQAKHAESTSAQKRLQEAPTMPDKVAAEQAKVVEPAPIFDAMFDRKTPQGKLSRKDAARKKKMEKRMYGMKGRNAFQGQEVGQVEAHTKGKFAQHGFRRVGMGQV